MASMEIMREVESVAFERDRQEFALGDTLDIKTGLILAALTFLAIQSGDLIKECITFAQWKTQIAVLLAGHLIPATAVLGVVLWTIQIVSILALIVGGVLSVAVLKPRYYDREASPKKYHDWIIGIEEYREAYPHTDTKPVTVQTLAAHRLECAINSVQANLATNKRKSDLMEWAFGCVAVSFAANIITLITHLF
jgi:hypothetical protein